MPNMMLESYSRARLTRRGAFWLGVAVGMFVVLAWQMMAQIQADCVRVTGNSYEWCAAQ